MHSKFLSASNQFLKSSTSGSLVVSQSNENNKPRLNLKLWQIALLIGLPSATLLTFFLYRRFIQTKNKQTEDISKKDLNSNKLKNEPQQPKKEQKPKVKPENHSSLNHD